MGTDRVARDARVFMRFSLGCQAISDQPDCDFDALMF
jgi:hypothetical protein